MKKKPHVFAIAAIALLTAMLARPASAQIYGQFTGAETVAHGGRMFGGYLVSSENTLGILAQLRLSFYPSVDFGFNGGISRVDVPGGDRTTVRLGTGIKVKLADSSAAMPVALALAGDLGIETGDDFHVLTLSPTLIGSRRFGMGTSAFTPYARAGIAISSVDFGPLNDTDVWFPLYLGGEFEVGQQLRLAVELQLHLDDDFGDDIGIAGGVNLPF